MGRTEITFGHPPPEARAELQGDLLVMALGKEAQPAAFELREGTLNTGPQNAFAAAAQTIPHRTPAFGDVAARAAGELVGAAAGRAVKAVAAALSRVPAPATRAQTALTTGGGEAAPAGGPIAIQNAVNQPTILVNPPFFFSSVCNHIELF